MYRLIVLLATIIAMPCGAEFRDPTQPDFPLPTADAHHVVSIEPVLSAIWISSHSRRAMINGISGKQGQTLSIEQVLAQPTPLESPQSAPLPTRSSTIKIVKIHKNSVVIDQNGQFKTLQLVHRSYKLH